MQSRAGKRSAAEIDRDALLKEACFTTKVKKTTELYLAKEGGLSDNDIVKFISYSLKCNNIKLLKSIMATGNPRFKACVEANKNKLWHDLLDHCKVDDSITGYRYSEDNILIHIDTIMGLHKAIGPPSTGQTCHNLFRREFIEQISSIENMYITIKWDTFVSFYKYTGVEEFGPAVMKYINSHTSAAMKAVCDGYDCCTWLLKHLAFTQAIFMGEKREDAHRYVYNSRLLNEIIPIVFEAPGFNINYVDANGIERVIEYMEEGKDADPLGTACASFLEMGHRSKNPIAQELYFFLPDNESSSNTEEELCKMYLGGNREPLSKSVTESLCLFESLLSKACSRCAAHAVQVLLRRGAVIERPLLQFKFPNERTVRGLETIMAILNACDVTGQKLTPIMYRDVIFHTLENEEMRELANRVFPAGNADIRVVPDDIFTDGGALFLFKSNRIADEDQQYVLDKVADKKPFVPYLKGELALNAIAVDDDPWHNERHHVRGANYDPEFADEYDDMTSIFRYTMRV